MLWYSVDGSDSSRRLWLEMSTSNDRFVSSFDSNCFDSIDPLILMENIFRTDVYLKHRPCHLSKEIYNKKV